MVCGFVGSEGGGVGCISLRFVPSCCTCGHWRLGLGNALFDGSEWMGGVDMHMHSLAFLSGCVLDWLGLFFCAKRSIEGNIYVLSVCVVG